MAVVEKKLVHSLVERQVQLKPECVAVVHDDSLMTFAQLDSCADLVAVRLHELGLVKCEIVAVCLPRCAAIPVVLLGILKSGSAFLPLDPQYPSDRLQFMLSDSTAAAVVMLAQEAGSRLSMDMAACPLMIHVDMLGHLLQATVVDAPNVATSRQRKEAYIIYTSGSTGQPKGVVVTHQNWRNQLLSFMGLLQEHLSEAATFSATTTLCFDPSLLELFLPLAGGCRLHVVAEEVVRDAHELAVQLVKYNTTIFEATPSRYQMLIAAGWEPTAKMVLLCGGEALPLSVSALSEKCSLLFNVYGPTETTIWSTVHPVREPLYEGSVPLGGPVRNAHLYLRDQIGDLIPIDEAEPTLNEPQELVIGGAGVTLGYWQRPELTAERFLQRCNGARMGGRVYRTGDLVQLDEAGELHFRGRIDHQVKINGYRVELGEVETVMSQFESVAQAAADIRRNHQNHPMLVGYVVWKPNHVPGESNLRHFLEKRFPSYMLPQFFMTLGALPQTLTGKLHRASLPSPFQDDVAYVDASSKGDLDLGSGEWPPSKARLREMVLSVSAAVIVGRLGVVSSPGTQAVTEEWRHLGLNSTMAPLFSAALAGRMRVMWPRHRELLPSSLAPTLMFEFPTVTALVEALHASCSGRLDEVETAISDGFASREIRHVVSLGNHCMTAHTIEACGLRRWPGPFDWIFVDPAMVTHCLRDNFVTFLQRNEYVAAGGSVNKAGHRVYSAMLQREVVFNHHNPMLERDYEFLSGCVDSFCGLLRPWPIEKASDERSIAEHNGMVLFLLFNLEKRRVLSDADVLQVFDQLSQQCRSPLQLLVVKIITCAEEKSPSHRLLLHQLREPAVLGDGIHSARAELFVHELRSCGANDGYRFDEERDTEALRRILLDGLVSSEGDGSSESKRYFAVTSAPPGGSCQEGGGISRAGAAPAVVAAVPPVNRAQRFAAALRDGQMLQRSQAGALTVVQPVLRKLLRQLGRGVPSTESPSHEADEVFRPLQAALASHPVFVAPDRLLRIWCPEQERWPVGLDALACGKFDVGDELSMRPCALLLVPSTCTEGFLNGGFKVVHTVSMNSELFLSLQQPANVAVKLPRSAEEYVFVGHRLP
eukprot:TRINITY_DN48447_c0_g1_i1.p1 TRINITY_DN48447_c0_g1~~TRINITY_DN48447_c0_g1_i1.p1  ORF type:complete len:1161 (+),score=134.13 TRINITY_DN48447_c0_g1_i1:174-3485(+)